MNTLARLVYEGWTKKKLIIDVEGFLHALYIYGILHLKTYVICMHHLQITTSIYTVYMDTRRNIHTKLKLRNSMKYLYLSIYRSIESITLFKFITLFCGTGIFCKNSIIQVDIWWNIMENIVSPIEHCYGSAYVESEVEREIEHKK